MALVPDQKFSTFQNGGNLIVGDIIVGLRAGLNTRFTFTGALPPGIVVPISQGGTGATTAGQARINLGLGTIAVQDASAVAITGGTISGVAITASTAALLSGSIVAAPSAGTDITNKTYVDSLVAGSVASVSGTLNRITSTGGTTPVIDIAATYVGQTSITTLGTITTGAWTATPIDLFHGGTNAALFANNGGIVYSTATAMAILSGTATANQVLLSGSTAAPAWSTATYPATTTVSQLLYSSSNNVIAGLSTANSAVLVTNSTGVPVFSSTMTNGQVIIGSTGATPTAATLTAGAGITITNAGGSITIAGSGSAGWVDQTTSSVTMAVSTGYTADAGASLITFTLPATSAIGDFVEINGKGSGLYTIAQGSGQQIHFGNLASTSGAGGTVSSTLQYDCIRLRCITANTIWTVVSAVGNFTVV